MQTGERSIFERGCLRAGEEWLELNLVPVAGTVVSTMVLQVLLSWKLSSVKLGSFNFLHLSTHRFVKLTRWSIDRSYHEIFRLLKIQKTKCGTFYVSEFIKDHAGMLQEIPKRVLMCLDAGSIIYFSKFRFYNIFFQIQLST